MVAVHSDHDMEKKYRAPTNFRYVNVDVPVYSFRIKGVPPVQIEYEDEIYYCIDKMFFIEYFHPLVGFNDKNIDVKDFPEHTIFVDNIFKFVGFKKQEDFTYWAMMLL